MFDERFWLRLLPSSNYPHSQEHRSHSRIIGNKPGKSPISANFRDFHPITSRFNPARGKFAAGSGFSKKGARVFDIVRTRRPGSINLYPRFWPTPMRRDQSRLRFPPAREQAMIRSNQSFEGRWAVKCGVSGGAGRKRGSSFSFRLLVLLFFSHAILFFPIFSHFRSVVLFMP